MPAKIVGFDPFSDVALLQVDPAGPDAAPAAARLDAATSQVGSPVAAIGSPFGEDQSLSVGVISALDRSIQSLTGFDDRRRDPDRRGDQPRQLGRPAARRARAACSASTRRSRRPAATARRRLRGPRRHGPRSLAQLRERRQGATTPTSASTTPPVFPQLARALQACRSTQGAWVQAVTPGGPADKAGLRSGGHRDALPGQRAYAAAATSIVAVGRPPVQRGGRRREGAAAATRRARR